MAIKLPGKQYICPTSAVGVKVSRDGEEYDATGRDCVAYLEGARIHCYAAMSGTNGFIQKKPDGEREFGVVEVFVFDDILPSRAPEYSEDVVISKEA